MLAGPKMKGGSSCCGWGGFVRTQFRVSVADFVGTERETLWQLIQPMIFALV